MLVKTYIYSGYMNTLLSQSTQKCLELENVLAPIYKTKMIRSKTIKSTSIVLQIYAI